MSGRYFWRAFTPDKDRRYRRPEYLARQTPGFSGADIANVCNEAALNPLPEQQEVCRERGLHECYRPYRGGLEKHSKVMTEAERKSIAIHEAGHADT